MIKLERLGGRKSCDPRLDIDAVFNTLQKQTPRALGVIGLLVVSRAPYVIVLPTMRRYPPFMWLTWPIASASPKTSGACLLLSETPPCFLPAVDRVVGVRLRSQLNIAACRSIVV